MALILFLTSAHEWKPHAFFGHFLFLGGFREAATDLLQWRLLTFLPCASRQKIRRVCFPFRPHLKMFFNAPFFLGFALLTPPRRTRPMVLSSRGVTLSRPGACSRACKEASPLCCNPLSMPPGDKVLENDDDGNSDDEATSGSTHPKTLTLWQETRRV